MQKISHPDQSGNRAALTLAICWLAYMCSYIGRYNYGAVIVGITESGVLSRADAGMVSSAFFFAYMSGQILHTFWIVRANPMRVVPVVMLITAVLNVLFICVPPEAMAAVWFLNGIVQSSLWPCMVRVLTEQLPQDRVTDGMVKINTSTAAGTIVAYLISSFCLRFLSWKAAFVVPAVLMAVMAGVWMSLMRSSARPEPAGEKERQTAAPSVIAEIGRALPMVLTTGFLCMLLAAVCNGFLRDGITTWLPTYIQDSFNTSASAATAFSVLVPIAQFAGPLAAQWVIRRERNTMKVSMVFYGVTAASVGCLLIWPGSIVLSCACFALCSLIMTGVNTVLISLYPLRFKKLGIVAPVSTFANTCVYVGSMIATSAIGMASENYGWNMVLGLLFGLSACACVLSLGALIWEKLHPQAMRDEL